MLKAPSGARESRGGRARYNPIEPSSERRHMRTCHAAIAVLTALGLQFDAEAQVQTADRAEGESFLFEVELLEVR